MHYRVESVALPRAKTFKNGDKAVAFAKDLAKNTTHEVRVVIVTRSSSFGNPVLYVFNRKAAPSVRS
jgi:hypothetical protein